MGAVPHEPRHSTSDKEKRPSAVISPTSIPNLSAQYFVILSALPHIAAGEMIADVVAIIGSLDIVLGEIDR